MITTEDFAQALTRLSEYQIGIQEAAVFFSADGKTNSELMADMDLEREAIYARIGVLRRKGLLKAKHRDTGKMFHAWTAKGQRMAQRAIYG